MAAVFLLAGPALIDLMATAPEVRAEARAYLPWMAAAPLDRHRRLDARRHLHRRDRDPGAAQRRDRSRSRSTPPPSRLLLPAFGNHGLWAALMILNATRGITLGLRYPALEARATT